MRKTRIRAPRRAPPVDVPTVWATKLGPAIDNILARSEDPLSFDDLYRSCYLLVSQQNGRSLYKAYNDHMRTYLENSRQLDGSLIEALAGRWQDLHLALGLIGDIFMYLNRGYCVDAKVLSVEKAGELLFRDIVVMPVVEPLYAQIKDTLHKERNGQSIDTESLKTVTEMLSSLSTGDPKVSDSLFNDQLLPILASSARDYYQAQLQQLGDVDALSVLRVLQEWVARERKPRVYLPADTSEALCRTVEEGVLPEALAKLFVLPSGLEFWIETNDTASLRLAADLEKKSGVADSALIASMEIRIKSQQQAINEEAAAAFASGGSKALEQVAADWVHKSIALIKKIRNIYEHICEFFNKDTPVLERLEKSWAACCNQVTLKNRRIMPEFLAIYSDQILKKSSSLTQHDQVERAMDDCIALFGVVADKDAFSTSYGVKLGRRLLQNKSQSRELERLFLSKLKTSPGQLNTSHFQIMMSDMDTSATLSQGFESSISTRVAVGRSGIWDSAYTKGKPCVLPPILAQCQAEFERYYSQKHFRRRLVWNFKLGSADVNLKFGTETYLVVLPVVCLSVLWLFQGDEELSAAEISSQTQIPLDDLVPTLQALSMVKPQRFLVKSSAGRQVETTDTFKFNNEFKSPKKVIRVQLLSSYVRSETSKAESEALKGLEVGRIEQIHAAIVRILKSRKTLGHAALVQEVAQVLSNKFAAPTSAIKRGINDLIDKDYLMRDEKDPNIYVYLA